MSSVWKTLSPEDLPVSDALKAVIPYGAPQLDVAIALNVNENPYPPSPELVSAIGAAVAAAAAHINRYPDRDAVALREDLARYLSEDSGVALQACHIWAANGSNEVLQQVMQLFGGPGRKALTFSPAYAMYEAYCRTSHTELITVPREADFSIDPARALAAISAHQPAVIFLTSPNNPTGTALPLAQIQALLEASNGMVVVDEAYGEFRREGIASAVTLLPAHPRLIVCRTMSKAFTFAGGRLGYCAATPTVIDAIQRVRLPYHLSALTQAAARAGLAAKEELLSKVSLIRLERDATVEWLREQGFTVADSDANFAFFGTFADRHQIWQGLLDEGVLIRESGPDGWLRVSIGTHDEMQAFRDALLRVLGRPAPQAYR